MDAPETKAEQNTTHLFHVFPENVLEKKQSGITFMDMCNHMARAFSSKNDIFPIGTHTANEYKERSQDKVCRRPLSDSKTG